MLEILVSEDVLKSSSLSWNLTGLGVFQRISVMQFRECNARKKQSEQHKKNHQITTTLEFDNNAMLSYLAKL